MSGRGPDPPLGMMQCAVVRHRTACQCCQGCRRGRARRDPAALRLRGGRPSVHGRRSSVVIDIRLPSATLGSLARSHDQSSTTDPVPTLGQKSAAVTIHILTRFRRRVPLGGTPTHNTPPNRISGPVAALWVNRHMCTGACGCAVPNVRHVGDGALDGAHLDNFARVGRSCHARTRHVLHGSLQLIRRQPFR